MLKYYIINIHVLYTKDKAYVKKEETGGGFLIFLIFI